MKPALSFLLVFCLGIIVRAQPEYIFQKDDSVLKQSYFQQSLKVKNERLSSSIKDHPNDYKKIYEDQFKSISDLLLTSRSVTAPDAHNYLQSLLRSIIIANPQLKDLNIRVLFSRDWWPNAYSLGDGTIVINAGLMIYLQNEAQLVFVLCHELAHYYLDHAGKAIRKYVDKINSEQFQNDLNVFPNKNTK